MINVTSRLEDCPMHGVHGQLQVLRCFEFPLGLPAKDMAMPAFSS